MNRPAIRFAAFTEAWEQRKLGDLGLVAMNRRIYREQTTETGDVPFYKIGTFGGEPDAYISRGLFEEYKSKYPYPEVGDILISASGSIGRTVEYTGKDEYFQDSNIVWLKHDERLNNSFLNHFYSLVKWHGLEGSTIKRLYNKNILDTEIMVPSPNEQKAVGSFFDRLNDLITRRQHEHDKTVNIKKALLEKMFPKEGADKPEIRFAGFTDAWEQLEFGNIVTPYAAPVPTPTDGYYRLGIRSHAKGTFHSYVRPGMELGTAQMHRVAANNFIVNITFGWEHAVAITNENDAERLVSHRFPQFSFNTNMVPDFFKFLIIDENFRHHLSLASPGGAGRNRVLKIDEMLEYKFWVPSADEQRQIAMFLGHLDRLIALHQRELTKLQNIKKALLERMFV